MSSEGAVPQSSHAPELAANPPLSQPTPISDIKQLVRSFTNRGAYAKLEDIDLEVGKSKDAQVTVAEVQKDEHDECHHSPEPLPSKKYGRVARNIRWTFLNVYERLAFIVLLPNLVMMVYLLVQPDTFSSPTRLSTPVAANITLTVLIRNEHIINFLFWSFGKAPKSWPLGVRRVIAKLYHLGGIHSGCGVAAILWFGLFNGAVMNMMTNLKYQGIRGGSFFITILLDLLLLNILVLSHPKLRARYHNMWEQMHRFAGWAAIGLFWLHLFLFNHVQYRLNDNKGWLEILYKTPNFYFLLITTFVIFEPWFRLKKVPVRAETLSDHAIRLHFTHQNLAICTTPRFSDYILKEWHAFAAIPAEDGVGYSVLISKAGDWTTKVIKTPPKELWTKGTPARGALYMGVVFKKIVVVATGSGIAPILSLLQAPNLEVRILWSTPGPPEKVFAPYIVDYVKKADSEAVIIDTRKAGRPNLVEEAWKIYCSSGAEAVFIISNAAVTRKFVYGLESRGVPTFAPIFDS
ncbi:hypothetical protein LTR05_007867 [Lithohypha guttulata]|uniref:Uncharacterized protein n=1 Tax=Lithohypha guttulata TaxID=1690604 RepID=A0AAN7Y8V4_9EURO|nr:hypothetical protein LTR05_007867 [Lithohypha guttulata]